MSETSTSWTPQTLSRPRVGYLCSYTPVEILTAAGVRPVRLPSGTGARSGGAHLPAALCPYLKACLGSALSAEDRQLDGVVVAMGCDGLRRIADVWSRYLPGFVYQLEVPRHRTSAAVAYFRGRLLEFARFLAGRCGRPVGQAALWDAIAQHNETRRLLGELDTLRHEGMAVPACELLSVVDRSVQEPPATFNPWLSDYVADLRHRGHPGGGAAVVLAGNVLTAGDRAVPQLIEEAGARVSGDSLCSGMRGVLGEVEMGDDPFLALARRYLERVPCPRMADSAGRFEDVVELCRRTEALGVIYVSQKFCDLSLYDFALLRSRLQKEDIACLLVELDAEVAALGQARTRIEAFLEMV